MTTRTHAPRVRELLATRWFRATARLVAGAAVLIAVVAQVGTGPFLHGLLSIDVRAIGAAILLTAVATAAAAWRWRVIAVRLGAGVGWPTAYRMYYRSQFLNSVLPGGVVGDVQRAIVQGRSAGNVAQATRAVVIERTMGQVVQVGLAVIVLAYFGLEFEGYLLSALGIALALLIAAAIVVSATSIRLRGAMKRELDELAAGVGSAGAFVQVVVASVVVVVCHIVTFGIAADAVGAHVPPLRLAAIALVVLIAGSIPLNIGGWGAREGIAAWTFAVAGFGASTGVAASTLFGILAIIAVAPGLIITVASAVRFRRTPAPIPDLALAGTHRKGRS
ncbi:lysylphosphatidylglycerol synthase transmembrane domain-containing protein [Leifsonia sp. NPDC058230]|uniref:lysylphosphatidylglycerol synthase transmembrane domain-containing protein n=1 Tax=Leifsonia sp. NPDC058230 TaxID=3346391 RepID=UPI0036DF1BB7